MRLSLEAWWVGAVEDAAGIQVPVLERAFNQPRDDHKEQNQHVDAGEHLVHHGRLFDAEGQ